MFSRGVKGTSKIMGISERKKEIKRRRIRRVRLKKLRGKLEGSTDDREQQAIRDQIRLVSPDALLAKG